MIRRSTFTRAVLAGFIAGSALPAFAVDDDIPATGDAYIRVGDEVLTTGLDECTRSGSFSDDGMLDACEGIDGDTVADATDDADVAPVAAAPQKAVIDTREISQLAFFDNDSDSLNADGLAAMDTLFGKLADFKGITAISVTGHTSARGAEDYNQALSERRARTIADLLAARYPDARMTVVGMGESRPVANNDTPQGAARNRRVEIEVDASRMTFE